MSLSRKFRGAFDMDEPMARRQWIVLRSAIQEILCNGSTGLVFENLYRIAYTMVLHKHSAILYDGLKEVIADHYSSKIKPPILETRGQCYDFCKEVVQSWTNHLRSIVWIRDILMYMDRVYKQPGVETVHNLGTIIFRREIIQDEEVSAALQSSILDLVRKDRYGEADDLDRTLLKETCKMLIDTGMGDKSIYQSVFESPFLIDSEAFYKAEGEKVHRIKTVFEYIKLVETRLNEETKRVEACFDPTTEVKITEIVDNQLIKRHMNIIVYGMEAEGIIFMLEYHKVEDLAAVYLLFNRVNRGLEILAEKISQYLRDQVQNYLKDGANPIISVQRLLDIKDRMDDLIQKSFNQDKVFQRMITDDFKYSLNSNPRSIEYLALFLDKKLSLDLQEISNQDNEAILDKTMLMFQLILPSHFFERHYKKHLMGRLLALLHKSLLCEHVSTPYIPANALNVIANGISLLKKGYGSQQTTKLNGMYKDLLTSNRIIEDFNTHSAQNAMNSVGVELTVRVLTEVFWPTSPTNLQNIILPQSALFAFEKFKKFYSMGHYGRKLVVYPALGSAEIIAHLDCSVDLKGTEGNPPLEAGTTSPSVNLTKSCRSYTIQVSTYQMCILDLFNTCDELTFEDILKKTEIPKADLEHALQSLTFGRLSDRLLEKNPLNPKSRTFNSTDVFRVNVAFLPQTERVIIKGNADCGEWMQTINNVTDCRKFEVESCIMGVMRSQKILAHDAFIVEVFQQLKMAVTPSEELVISVLEELIQRNELHERMDVESNQKQYSHNGANRDHCA